MPTRLLMPLRPTPPTLPALAADLRAARAEVRARRRAPVVPEELLAARRTLLRTMEAFASELTARRLPIPPQMRDELRLLGEGPSLRGRGPRP